MISRSTHAYTGGLHELMAKIGKDIKELAPERRAQQVYQVGKIRIVVQLGRPFHQMRGGEPVAEQLGGNRRIHVRQVGYKLRLLALNYMELDCYAGRGVAVAVVIYNDAKQVDRSRKHDNEPQQRQSQIFLNCPHRVRSQQARKYAHTEDYIVTGTD